MRGDVRAAREAGWFGVVAAHKRHAVHTGKGPNQGLGGRMQGTRAQRTLNIWLMFLTLDVSKLSDWLNTDACCRVEKREGTHALRAGRRAGRGVCGSGASGIHGEGPTEGCFRAERTTNM